MKYVIDEELVYKEGLTLPQILLLLYYKSSGEKNVQETIKELTDMEAIVTFNHHTSVTQRWSDVCDQVLLSSDKYVPTDEELFPLAEKLMATFPQGKKEGTPYYWKCNKREVTLKLKSFYKLYGNIYTQDQILDAAERYVASFNGDYRYMRLLKYFIWKKEDGVETSDLATFIDNADQTDENSNWVVELR